MADDDFKKFLIDFSNYDCFDECTDSETDKEKLRSTRERVNWRVEAERHGFYWKFCGLIRDWRGQLPDLREIFLREEIDWLLAKCAETGPIDFIDFVVRTGYRDGPDRLDEDDGESRWRRVTAVHEAARHRHGDWVAMVRELFKVYGRFDVDYSHAQSGLCTHFHVACAAGCVGVVKKFLDFGQSPNCLVPRTGDSPLHLALREKRKKVAKLLLRRGADPSLANARGVTPLHAISDKSYGDGWANLLFEICDEVRATVRLDAPDEFGYMPLHRALRCGNAKLVESLLRRGAKPNSAYASGVTPLHVISDKRYDDGCAKAFFRLCNELRLTIRLDTRDRSGRTALHWAAHHGNTRFLELLLRRGADPDVADKDGFIPLHFIVERQVDDDATEIFLRIADDVNRPLEVDAQNHEDETPLHLALRRGNAKAAEALLRRGADPNMTDEKGLSPLHFIASRTTDDDDGLIKKFFEICADVGRVVRVDARDKEMGRTPLHLALTSNNKRAAAALLRGGADPNSADEKGLSPLHIIGRARELDVDSIEMLFELGSEKCKPVQVDARDKNGETPLHLALRHGNERAAESLLRRGADPHLGTAYKMHYTSLHIICSRGADDDAVETFSRTIDEIRRTTVPINALDKAGRTPLHLAVLTGNKKAAEALLRRGADTNVADNDGLTPLHFVAGREVVGDDATEIFLRMADGVNRPMEVDARSHKDRTPLHLALRRGNVKAAESLLRRGADPNSTDEKGLSPLHFIASRTTDDDDGLMEKFFEICADVGRVVQVDARDKEMGRTPLHLAMSYGHKRIVASLLRGGADPNSADLQGSTALHVICQRYDPSDDDLMKIFFVTSDDRRRPVEVDARDRFGRTPLQWAVANLLPSTVDFLLDKAGADLSSFAFPTEDYFCQRFDRYDGWNKLRLASGALVVVERLVERGYELVQSDVREIMKLFENYGLFEKSSLYLEKCWHDDREFTRTAERITIVPGLSLCDVIQSRAEKLKKLLAYADYFEFAITGKLDVLHARHKEACTVHLCEKLSRQFFRSWSVYPFWELIHKRLPLECCQMIIEELQNEDLFGICQATEIAAKTKRQQR